MRSAAAARIYELVTQDDDGRTCDAIPEEACRHVPGNFLLNALNGASTKLAEQLASPGLVLPWLLGAVGAPVALVGFLVPVRRAGALLPQLAVAGRIRTRPIRKWFWVGAGLAQAVLLAAMIPAVLLAPPIWAGISVVALLALFSVASVSLPVAYKDVLAKTVPQGRRGTLLATRATAGGILAVGASLWLRTALGDDAGTLPYLVLLGAAATLWALGAALFAGIREEDGATEGGRTGLEEARAGWHLLADAPGFRRFVLTRACLLSASLVLPFLTLQARESLVGAVRDLTLFVVASSVAAVIASPLWGRWADRDPRSVMAVGGAWVAGTVVLALFVVASTSSPWAWAGIFLSAGFARAGVRLGRKTYLVDAAPDDERPLMVAVSNTATGGVMVAAGGAGLLAEWLGVPMVLAGFAGLAGTGAVLARTLPATDPLKRRVAGAG